MSTREWNTVMYGIDTSRMYVSNNVALNFINKHKDAIKAQSGIDDIDLPENADELFGFLNGYEDNCGNSGMEAIIADVASYYSKLDICVTCDQDGYCYIGLFAHTVFPWDNACSDGWKNATPENIEAAIKPLVEELCNGYCPEFEEQVIWYYG